MTVERTANCSRASETRRGSKPAAAAGPDDQPISRRRRPPLIRQVGEPDRGTARERMIGRQRDHERLAEDVLAPQPVELASGSGRVLKGHRHVQLACPQPPRQRIDRALLDCDHHVRAGSAQRVHRRRHEPGECRRHGPDPQRGRLAVHELAQLDIRELQSLGDHRRVLHQRSPRLGQHQAVGAALEQPRTHVGLERGDLLRDCRLRQRQRSRGTRERPLTRDGREGHHTTRVENPGILAPPYCGP